jgi:hypothetical protein
VNLSGPDTIHILVFKPFLSIFWTKERYYLIITDSSLLARVDENKIGRSEGCEAVCANSRIRDILEMTTRAYDGYFREDVVFEYLKSIECVSWDQR